MNKENLHKAFLTILTTVLVACGGYLINSRVQTANLGNTIDNVERRTEALESNVKDIDKILNELQVSRATTNQAILNLKDIADNLSNVTDRLNTSVIKLEEKLKE